MGRDPGAAGDPGRAAAQALVADLGTPELDDETLHHLSRVLRLRAGAEVRAVDGAGGWRDCAFTGDERLDPLGEPAHEPAPEPVLTVAFALVKGERPELVVQKLTEIGVDRIVPFVARRSVVRWDHERAERHLARLRRVAVEACAQCRRLHLPEIVGADGGGVLDTDALVASVGGVGSAVAADAGGRPLRVTDRIVFIGPEGGWAEDEFADRDELDRVGLGPHVLRAETAAIAAGALMIGLRSGLVAPAAGDEASRGS